MYMNILCGSWAVAYREKNKKRFRVIPNPAWGYAADPFIVERDGETYIFAELFDCRKGKAGIGYTIIGKGKQKWKLVIEEKYHISYPFLFQKSGDWYICPESSNNKDVYFYKAVGFPDKWIKQSSFITNMDCSDTTLLFSKDSDYTYGVTCVFHNNPIHLLLFRMKNGNVEFSSCNPIAEGSELARPGGNFIVEKDKIYRVSQDCTNGYGRNLVFTEFNITWPKCNEKLVCRIGIRNIRLNKPMFPIGIHTYNRSENYEVIDLKLKRVNFKIRIRKLGNLLKRKIRLWKTKTLV